MTRYHFDERWIGEHGIGRFAKELFARLEGVQAAGLSGSPAGALDPIRSASWLTRHKKDVFFSPGFNAPLWHQARSIITVHDLIHVDIKEEGGALKDLYYSGIVKPACRKAKRVFTVSEFSRQRIIDWSGASPDRVVNVGNGVSSVFGASQEDSEVAPLPMPYFFCVSNRKAHKNEKRLLEAFRMATAGSDTMLAITGKKTPDILHEIEKNGLLGRVHFTGRLDDSKLAHYYRFAKAVLFPSLYEGFGLPVVEGMACGTPVLTSTLTSLPEVAGEAALLVDPLSVEAIADGIDRLHCDDALRESLIERGLMQAKLFTWERVAQRAQAALDG